MIPFPFQAGQLGRRLAGPAGAPAGFNTFQGAPYPPGVTQAPTLSNGDRTWTTNTTSLVNGAFHAPRNFVPANQKAYWEWRVDQLNDNGVTGYILFGIARTTSITGGGYVWYVYGGLRQVIGGTTSPTVVGAPSVGMIIMAAVDDANGLAWLGRDGTWFTTGSGTPNPAAGTGRTFAFTPGNGDIGGYIQGRSGSAGAANIVTVNTGQAAYAYTPPAGFGNY